VSNSIKQRMVGAIVLSVLGFVLLPLLFDFAEPEPIDRQSLIPAAPEISAAKIPVAERPPGLVKPQQVAPLFDVDASRPDNLENAADAGLDESGLPSAWVLQVGSFEKQALAQELMDSLREKQFKAFKKRVKLAGGTMYRVYVGPKIDRQRAIAAKAEIDQLLDTDSLLLKYVP